MVCCYSNREIFKIFIFKNLYVIEYCFVSRIVIIFILEVVVFYKRYLMLVLVIVVIFLEKKRVKIIGFLVEILFYLFIFLWKLGDFVFIVLWF